MTEQLDILPLDAARLDDAAALLAAQQRRLRAARPELPSAYEDAGTCRPLVAALLEQEGAHGVLALRDGEPAGFLAGYPRHDEIWARAAWSPAEGAALADDLDPEHVRDLYAAWSAHFVGTGHFRQYVHASPDDRALMAAWVRTGFGQMQAYAVRDLDLHGALVGGVTLRRVVPDDIDALEPLLPLIALALMRPPAYAISLPETLPTHRDSWLEELAEAAPRHWAAFEGNRALAMASFYPADPGLLVPTGAWYLAVAMTLPEARGRGLMRSLLVAGFADARDAGATHCITDWRTAALPTHRSWTALGFRPTHYRMHRHIDERIAWAAPAEERPSV